MSEKQDPVGEAKMVLAFETIAKYVKNNYDAFVNVGFSRAEALELAQAALVEIVRQQQKSVSTKTKGKSHGTGNI